MRSLRLAVAILAVLLVVGLSFGPTWDQTVDMGRDAARALKFRLSLRLLEGVSRRGGLRVAMPDGVALATDIYLPKARSGPVPAILVRLPYGRTRYWEARHWISLFAPAGYAVVVQDMRGRWGSEGQFAPWRHAAGDGTATLDWITEQGWSDGQVATVGCSALGESQVVLAAHGPESLRAILPIGAGGAIGTAGGLSQFFGTFEGGIPTLAGLFGWFANYGGQTAAFMAKPEDIDYPAALATLPILNAVADVRDDPTGYEWMLEHFEDTAAMAAAGYIQDTDRFATPAFLVDGWYDPNVNATLALARQMARDGVLQHVMIGPGRHCDFGRAFGDGAVGDIPVDGSQARDMDTLYLTWMDHLLRRGPAPDLPPYLVYVMVEDTWLASPSWPPPGAETQQLFLDGPTLTQAPPPHRSHRGLVSDPTSPVPTIGGAICCTGNPDLRTGPLDQRPIEGREDLLVYDSAPLTAPLRLAGPIAARLWLEADVPDTDVVVRLTDVSPDGRSITIQEGALRLRYRDGFAAPRLMTPGEVVEARVTLRDIAYLVRAGHRLRLHVAGSSFPRLARNLGGRGDPARESVAHTARVTLHSGADTPSRLIFSALPDG